MGIFKIRLLNQKLTVEKDKYTVFFLQFKYFIFYYTFRSLKVNCSIILISQPLKLLLNIFLNIFLTYFHIVASRMVVLV